MHRSPQEMTLAVAFHMTWMTAVVVLGTFLLSVTVELVAPRLSDPLCARLCYAPGVTENPNITLIGAD